MTKATTPSCPFMHRRPTHPLFCGWHYPLMRQPGCEELAGFWVGVRFALWCHLEASMLLGDQWCSKYPLWMASRDSGTSLKMPRLWKQNKMNSSDGLVTTRTHPVEHPESESQRTGQQSIRTWGWVRLPSKLSGEWPLCSTRGPRRTWVSRCSDEI